MAANSLNSVVSSLVRASMGASVQSSVTDEELDRHVQELIVKEAKKKAEQYAERGVRAFLPEREDKQPRANKRFLSSIIRHTDDHNKAILKAQSDAALEAKMDREEQERNERRARAAEATEAERIRRLGHSLRDKDSWNKKRDSFPQLRRSRSRDRDTWERDRKKRRRRTRSRSPPNRDEDDDRRRKRKERQRGEDDREEHRSFRRRREHSESRTPERDKSYTSRHTQPSSRGRDDGIEESTGLSKVKSKDKLPRQGSCRNSQEIEEQVTPIASSSRTLSKLSPFDLSAQFESRKAKAASPPPPASPTLSEEENIERLRPRRRLRRSPKRDFPSPESPHAFSSRMDKYFEQSYDPRLDTGPMSIPDVPATGLVDGAEFESWEAMLDIIRQRREDKAERKRLERAGILPSGGREKGVGSKSMTSTSDAWTMDAGPGLMDIKYSKRSAVREWDVGKEGF